jgi:hypothetical protein
MVMKTKTPRPLLHGELSEVCIWKLMTGGTVKARLTVCCGRTTNSKMMIEVQQAPFTLGQTK